MSYLLSIGQSVDTESGIVWCYNYHALESKGEWSLEVVLKVAVVTWCTTSEYARGTMSPCYHWISFAGDFEWCIRPQDIRRSRESSTVLIVGGVNDSGHSETTRNAIVREFGHRLDSEDTSGRKLGRKVGRGLVE